MWPKGQALNWSMMPERRSSTRLAGWAHQAGWIGKPSLPQGEKQKQVFVVQNERRPGEMQNALRDLMRDGVESVRVCSAYVTLSGSAVLLDGIQRSSPNGDHERVRKTIVASLDFGLTDPEALEFWKKVPGCSVLVAGVSSLVRDNLNPSIAFHPKLYVFGRPNGTIGSLIGSANLTSRGLTMNSEAGWRVAEHVPSDGVDAAWEMVIQSAIPLTWDILDRYRSLRKRAFSRQSAEEVQPVPQPNIGQPNSYQPFLRAVADPLRYRRMWIQSHGLQGGSRTQLELPRDSCRFFGGVQETRAEERVGRIANPVLLSGHRVWRDCALTWHPNNRMERINLPSVAKGGYKYENSLILFRRLDGDRFELQVHPWDSDSCRALVEASRIGELMFRVGRNSSRFYGLLP